jgi:hypothetical protein
MTIDCDVLHGKLRDQLSIILRRLLNDPMTAPGNSYLNFRLPLYDVVDHRNSRMIKEDSITTVVASTTTCESMYGKMLIGTVSMSCATRNEQFQDFERSSPYLAGFSAPELA